MGLEPASVLASVSPCVLPCVHTFKHEYLQDQRANQNHPDHHCGGGLTALGFVPDRIRTLVSMARDRSHRVIMGELL